MVQTQGRAFPSRRAVEADRLVQLVLLPKPCDFVADQSLRNRRNDLPGQGADRLVGVGGDPLADGGADAFDLLLRSGVGDAAGFREDLALNLAEELVDRGGGAREALELLADEALDERGHDLPGECRRRLLQAAPAFPEDLLLELRQELVDRGGGAREALELLADEALDERGHDLPGECRRRLLQAAPAFPEDLLLELRQELVDRGGGAREALELLADEALSQRRHNLPGESANDLLDDSPARAQKVLADGRLHRFARRGRLNPRRLGAGRGFGSLPGRPDRSLHGSHGRLEALEPGDRVPDGL